MKVHLPPSVYGALQRVVHDDHWQSYGLFTRMLDLEPGETILEIGCGIGSLAYHFIRQGFDYWGIDSDAERVKTAQGRFPDGNFLVCNALKLDEVGLPPFRRVFIHGVLHHCDDDACRQIFAYILGLRPDMVLGLIEPYRPTQAWRNPIGALFADMDEGNYVRTLEGWRGLMRPNAVVFERVSLWPRWPVGMLNARLRPSHARPTTGENAAVAAGSGWSARTH